MGTSTDKGLGNYKKCLKTSICHFHFHYQTIHHHCHLLSFDQSVLQNTSQRFTFFSEIKV